MEFERLIETERQNDALLRRGREEAAAIREAAVAAAEQHEALLAAELAVAMRESDAALAERRARSLADIAARAQVAADRFDAVTDAQIAAVAATLIEQIVRDGGEA